MEIVDIGGAMVIHLFGAYFGLAASWLLTPPGAKGNKDNSAVYRYSPSTLLIFRPSTQPYTYILHYSSNSSIVIFIDPTCSQ